MVWNTGLNNIGNALADAINILDGEDQSLAVSVGSGQTANFKSVIFPWCDNTTEVRNKAFRIKNLRTGNNIAYLFQEYQTNKICWSAYSAKDPWGERKRLNDGAESNDYLDQYSAIDIIIQPDRVWGFPATSQNMLAKEVLETTLQIIGAVTGILGVGAGGGTGGK